MTIPDFQTFMLPLLKLPDDGTEQTLSGSIDQLADQFQLSEAERNELLPSGRGRRINNRVGWAATYLRKIGLLRAAGRGRFQITDRGRALLESKPAHIDMNFLKERFAQEYSEFRPSRRREAAGNDDSPTFNEDEGAWIVRPEGIQRLAKEFERRIPDEQIRRSALGFLAFAIENVDEERSDAWHLALTARRLKLVAGGVLACGLARSVLQIGIIGPVKNEVREALGAEPEADGEIASIPGSLLLKVPIARSGEALNLLRDGLNAFVDAAMARVRRAPSLEHHVPDAVAWISSVVGRELPQPEPAGAENADEESETALTDGDQESSREPQIRGRAQIFERGERTVASLVSDIERGVIALPDLQRPFVWEDTKVRNLFDSLLIGFPVGTLVLWHTSEGRDARELGGERGAVVRPPTLVIDGQQRLTSLLAVMTGKELVRKDGERRKITIAFRPRDGRFEVADAATKSDPEFLPNATDLWTGTRPNSQIRRDLINALRDQARTVDEKYEDAVERNLEIAKGISNYRFPTIDLRETGNQGVSEEDISEIFVRINNEGTRLRQADFVLTLLSVYHLELRDQIEDRALEMSEGAPIALDTQQLLRAACGVAFNRARMSAVYRYLRGIDPTTREVDAGRRGQMIEQLDTAAKECMERTPWRDFLLRVKHAGFVSPALIASKNAIVNAYALYIRGRRADVPKARLDELVGRWVFWTLMTARYSGSSESVFEQDLVRVSGLDAEGFVRVMDETLGASLSGDYWTHTLVKNLETAKARAPSALAFRASQVVLGARALFSDQLLQNVLDPPAEGGRAAGEAHHLFPREWLQTNSVRDRKRINQVANLADVGWHENNVIGSLNPAVYVPGIRQQLGLGDELWGRQCAEHALPLGWESMDYDTFLVERRRRMADMMRVAFRKLGGESDAQPVTPPWFLPGAELVWQKIAEVERALRAVVREVYTELFREAAAAKIEEAIPEQARKTMERALRARPSAADPLTLVDYLYLAQLPPLLFAAKVAEKARERMGGGPELKQRLLSALDQIAPVRNEIAHVREVAPERLQRANVACNDVLDMVRTSPVTNRGA